MANHYEYELQKAVSMYLKLQHPDILFMSDTVANLMLTEGQKKRNKAIQKQGFQCPDVLIFKPNKTFHGLFIELKAKTIYKKDGVTLLKNEHVEGQQETINDLLKLGYHAQFCIGFDESKKVIDWYLNLE